MSEEHNDGGPAFPRPSWAPNGYGVGDIESADAQMACPSATG